MSATPPPERPTLSDERIDLNPDRPRLFRRRRKPSPDDPTAPTVNMTAADGPASSPESLASSRGLPAPAPGGTASSPRGAGRNSLQRRLTIQVAIIAGLATALIIVCSTIFVRQLMVGQIDDQLDQSFVRQRTTEVGASNRPNETLANPGTTVGTIVVAQRIPSGRRIGAVIADGRPPSVEVLDRDVIAQVLELVPGTTRTMRLQLDPDGDSTIYRVTMRSNDRGYWAVGLPMTAVDSVTTRLVLIEGVLGLIVIMMAVLVSQELVKRSLRPLARLAATADQVSRLDLATGDVELNTQVPEFTAAPDSEVGRLSRAFGHMLSNVEGALATRQRSESQVRQFVADASHELRNPLASIRGYAELTRREHDQLPPTTAHAMDRIEAESERMSHLVEEMLLLARLDAGPNVTIEEVDAVELVLNAVSDSRAAAPDHRWLLNLPNEPVTVQADRRQLQQAVGNLLTNAWRHTPAGTTVRTSVEQKGGWMRIAVADDGPGIPPEIRNHVFERFARADVSRTDSRQGSTGLGLAIVASVMEALGGSASMQTTPTGTTFNLFLPLAGRPDQPA